MKRPAENEYASYYHSYIEATTAQEANEALTEDFEDTMSLLKQIDDQGSLFKYDVDKWSIKEVIQHCIDVERVFAYRALCFSRNDHTALPGFDQDNYLKETNADARSWKLLLDELHAVRISSVLMFASFTNEQMLRIGKASGNDTSVRAIGFIIAGHLKHHTLVLKERYLNNKI